MTDITEKSMPLKEKFSVTAHNSPRNKQHSSPCRIVGEAPVSIRRQKAAKRSHRPQSLLGFHGKDRAGWVNSSGLVNLDNSGDLWGIRAASGCLEPGLG